MMRRFHVALGVSDIQASVTEYTHRFGAPPTLVIPGEYALWRTDSLNVSIRRVDQGPSADGRVAQPGGALRHLGWEDDAAPQFSAETDVNGIVWEHFSAEQQDAEIAATWPAG